MTFLQINSNDLLLKITLNLIQLNLYSSIYVDFGENKQCVGSYIENLWMK